MTKKSFIRFFPRDVLALDLDELDLDEDEEDGKKAQLSIHFQPKKINPTLITLKLDVVL